MPALRRVSLSPATCVDRNKPIIEFHKLGSLSVGQLLSLNDQIQLIHFRVYQLRLYRVDIKPCSNYKRPQSDPNADPNAVDFDMTYLLQ